MATNLPSLPPKKLPETKSPGELSVSKKQSDSLLTTSKDKSPSDFKKFRDAKKQELEDARAEAKQRRERAKKVAEDRKTGLQKDAETIKNNRSEDMKAGGVAKLSAIVQSQAVKLTSLIIPNLLLLTGKALESKGTDLCPPPEVTQQLLNSFNNIVKDINVTVESVDKLAKISTAASTGANTLQTISTGISTTIPVVSTAAKAIPLIPGVVVSALDDLDYINNKLLYKNDGTPRLPPIIAGVNAVSMSLSLFTSTLRNATGLVNSLSLLLSQCLPEGQKTEIESLSANTEQYADYGNDNYNNYDNTSYKGFVIKIEEIPYTPTVNRRRAVGYTTNGVPLIQTELSFSTNNQTLVAELKLIIDRDDLKAY
jgi:hypothetical protein